MHSAELVIRTSSVQHDVTLLSVSGAITMHTFDKLDGAIRTVIDKGNHRVLVDLGNVAYFSSAGAGVLMNAHLCALERNGKVVMVNIAPVVNDVLDTLNLKDILPIAANAHEGMKMFQ